MKIKIEVEAGGVVMAFNAMNIVSAQDVLTRLKEVQENRSMSVMHLCVRAETISCNIKSRYGDDVNVDHSQFLESLKKFSKEFL